MSLPAAAAAEEPEVDVKTIADLPFHVLGRVSKSLLIGRARGGKISGSSSREFFESVRDMSLGFTEMGLKAGDRVAILAESRPEWLVADLAVLARGAVTVPVYPTLSAPGVRYILQDSGARIAVVSTKLQLDKIQEIRHQLPALEEVVTMDAATAGVTPSVVSFENVSERGHSRLAVEWGAGRAFQETVRTVSASDLATIIYTSGTTGEPKGVMLNHSHLVSNLKAAAVALEVSQDDVALSFLPLSHAFERMVAYVYLLCGVTLVFAESFDTIARDVAAVRPTVLTGVPRVYEKLQARIMDKALAGKGVRSTLFKRGLQAGLARAHADLRGRSTGPLNRLQAALADRFVFDKVRAALGGRIRYLVSGSAPLAPSVAEFFHALGLPIIEGYGLTETAPILTVNPPDAPRVGTVGRALPDVELKIADDGEILARGPNIMAGYYNKPEATAEVLKDGWFHTGDIGTIDEQGYVSITDRKKDLLVTSGGKKVAPQPIESTLKRNPLVAEAVVLGDRRKYVAALIVPDFTALERRLKDLGRPPADRAALGSRDDVHSLYQEIVDALNRELSQYERIKKVAILPREFTMQSGELTPTLKVKRKVVEERWREVIEGLYAEH